MDTRRNATLDLAAILRSRHISIEEIASATRIGAFYLRAIEEGTLEKLPGHFYARSYIRQYARAIDFDENELLQDFDLLPAPPEEIAPQPSFLVGAVRWR